VKDYPKWSRKPVILLVDDQPRNLQLLGNALFNNGYDVALASSGREALDLIAESAPDLVLLDVMMPDMDGFEACEKLKSSGMAPDLEVIFVTAKTQREDLLRGFDVGGVDYITKPIQIPEVLARVKSQISLKFAKDELRQANRKLSRVIEDQQRFLSILSHDVRAPLYGINHLLYDGCNHSDELSKHDLLDILRTCEDSSRRLASFFEDTLVWASSETGGYEEAAEPISLLDSFELAKSLLSSLFNQKEVNLVAEIEEGLAVVGKPNALGTVIRNLISNAVKYSKTGGKVIFRCERDGDRVRISVIDYGVGISPDRIQELFDPDKRQSTLGTDREKGAGLGLFLCQSLVENLGGRLQVQSEENEGSVFSFSLPSFDDSGE